MMLAFNRYRALLDRFFVLAEMEKLAAANLREAVQVKAATQQLAMFREELHLIHQEKLKLFANLQSLVLTTGAIAPASASPP